MAKILINLLPVEFTKEQSKDAKFYKLQTIGVVMILLVIFLSSFTVALGVLQSQRLKLAEKRLDSMQERIVTFQDKQVSLMALKNRLTAINQYIGVSSLQAGMFNLVNTILPPSVSISSLSISKLGEITISAQAPDSITVNQMIIDLTDKEKNKEKISKVSLESLNRGRDGVYRLNLKIKPK